jgi:hypothetical protein
MIPETSLLVRLVLLVEPIPLPPRPRRRGRSAVSPDRLFRKAGGIMVVRRLPPGHRRLAVLDDPTPEMPRRRIVLTVNGRYPTRRTFERRLKAIPSTLPAQSGWLGQHVGGVRALGAPEGAAAAIDRTPLRALGGVWHHKERARGKVPPTTIDTAAHGTTSGWHGGVEAGRCLGSSASRAAGFPWPLS